MSKFRKSSAQLDTVHCEDSSTMADETQPLSSQSSQGTDNILSGPEGETDTMSSQSSKSTLPETRNQYLAGWKSAAKIYTRKAREICAATLSVLSPGQEDALRESLRREPMLENEGTVAKSKVFWRQVRLDWSLNRGS